MVESSVGFIKAHQKKTEVIHENVFKLFEVYHAVFQELLHLIQYCGSMCCPWKISMKFKILYPSFVTFGCNRSRIQSGLVPRSIAEKDQGCVSPFFPINDSSNEEGAKLACLPPGKSILHRWFIYS